MVTVTVSKSQNPALGQGNPLLITMSYPWSTSENYSLDCPFENTAMRKLLCETLITFGFSLQLCSFSVGMLLN